MDQDQLDYFRTVLLEERQKILANAAGTLKDDMEVSGDDMRDETDLASAVYSQGLALRLRDRETRLLSKVAKALRRIEVGEFGICEVCDDEIAIARLKARPVTTMCIECKDEQERREKNFAKHVGRPERDYTPPQLEVPRPTSQRGDKRSSSVNALINDIDDTPARATTDD